MPVIRQFEIRLSLLNIVCLVKVSVTRVLCGDGTDQPGRERPPEYPNQTQK